MNLTPRLLIEMAGLVELYNREVEAAKAENSDGGKVITAQEKFGIAIAVGGPAIKRFFIPSLPDEAIERAAQSVAVSLGKVGNIRSKAAAVLDKVETAGSTVIDYLT